MKGNDKNKPAVTHRQANTNKWKILHLQIHYWNKATESTIHHIDCELYKGYLSTQQPPTGAYNSTRRAAKWWCAVNFLFYAERLFKEKKPMSSWEHFPGQIIHQFINSHAQNFLHTFEAISPSILA
jgi:hypothetical protein